METPKLGATFILRFNALYYTKFLSTRSGSNAIKGYVRPAPSTRVFGIIKCNFKMDAAPSFGVSMDI